jgi:hypothetical protein
MDNDGYSVFINLQRIYRWSGVWTVQPYFAAGVTAGLSDYTAFHESSAGLVLSVGSEWKLSRSIGLLGEYESSLTYTYRNDRVTTYIDTDEYSIPVPPHRSKSVELGANSVRLGLAVYW